MQFSYSSNYPALQQRFDQLIVEMRDPAPLKLVNPVPYIRVLEYGGVRVYTRRRRQRKQGVFRFPKGGVVTREPLRTIVFQPPHAMVRRSRWGMTQQMRQLCRAKIPKRQTDLQHLMGMLGLIGLREVRSFTHVDEDVARQGWRLTR